MLKTVLVAGGVVLLGALQGHAVLIAKWNFEVNTPADAANSTTIGPIAADIGSGSASGVHASATSDWTTPAGNGSVNSLSVNTWTIGDYFQFQTSLSGYQNVTLFWEQTRSSTAPSSFKLQYSTDGSIFTDFGGSFNPYSVVENGTVGGGTWSSNPLNYRNGYSFSANLSSITTLNNDSSVFFRLTATSAGSDPAGASRVDDFTINADVKTVVPEASTWVAGLGLSLGMLGSFVRKYRK